LTLVSCHVTRLRPIASSISAAIASESTSIPQARRRGGEEEYHGSGVPAVSKLLVGLVEQVLCVLGAGRNREGRRRER
jgi:hypothetical protein